MESFVLLYALGVAVALWRTDGSAATRVTMAALWPVGVLAAAITTVILLTAAAVLFPLFGLMLVAGGALGIWRLVS